MDNTTLNPGIGGDVSRSKDRSGVKTQIVALDLAPNAGSEQLMTPGQQVMALSIPVAIASNQTVLPTKEVRAPGYTGTNVAASATNVTLLASNTARLGATVYNDSTATLYLKLGATASATSFTVKMIADSYYETPFNYTGQIDGVWASATGVARIGELV